MNFNKWFLLLILTLILTGSRCKRNGEDHLPASRSFFMGFTPFPYDYSMQAVNETYAAIQRDGDIVLAHFDTGVPWNEALNDLPFPARVQNDIDRVRQHIPSGKKIFLTATPNSTDRETLAKYWNDSGEHQPLPAPWNTYDFDHPDVIAAYIKYCKRLIDAVQPDFFAFGIEVNGGLREGTAHFDHFLILADTVYRRLKADYPGMPVMMTFQDQSYNKTHAELMSVTRRLLDYSDFVAVSTYPFWYYDHPHADANPQNIPGSWLEEMHDLAPSKPFAVSETGYAAEDLEMPSIGVDIHCTETWQKQYVDKLFRKANDLNARFVIWFVYRDYDRLYDQIMQGDEFARIWKDNGVLDGDGHARTSHDRWVKWLNVPIND